MVKKILKNYKYLALAGSLLAGANSVQAKKSIKELTSDKNASKLAREVTQKKSKKEDLSERLNAHSLGIGLGQTFLYGDFKDNGENSISWDAFYAYSASYSFDMLVNYHSQSYTYKNRKTRLQGATLSLKGKLYQVDAISPFVLGGLGFYWPKVKRLQGSEVKDSKSKTVFGANVGAGIDLNLNSNYSVGVLAQYHNPFDVKQDGDKEVAGSYFKLLLTGFYTF